MHLVFVHICKRVGLRPFIHPEGGSSSIVDLYKLMLHVSSEIADVQFWSESSDYHCDCAMMMPSQ